MARVLRRSVFLENPESHVIVSLATGQTVPDWAEPLLSGADHLFEDDAPTPRVEKKRTVAHKAEAVAENEPVKVPAKTASAAAWRKFAKASGVSIPSGASRDDIIQRVLDEIPDLDIIED